MGETTSAIAADVQRRALPGDAVSLHIGHATLPPSADVFAAEQVDASYSRDGVTLSIKADTQVRSFRISRRALLELAAGMATLPTIPADSGLVSRAVDPAVVEHFHALRALLVGTDNKLGGLTVLSIVYQQLVLIAQFRQRARAPSRPVAERRGPLDRVRWLAQ